MDTIDTNRVHNTYGLTLFIVVCLVYIANELVGRTYIALFEIANSFKQAIRSNDCHFYEIWPYQHAQGHTSWPKASLQIGHISGLLSCDVPCA